MIPEYASWSRQSLSRTSADSADGMKGSCGDGLQAVRFWQLEAAHVLSVVAWLMMNLLATPCRAAADQRSVHIVREGETLPSIAESHYGDRYFTVILSLYNDVPEERRLGVGRRLLVPPVDSILEPKHLFSGRFMFALDVTQVLTHLIREHSLEFVEVLWQPNSKFQEGILQPKTGVI